MNVSKHNEFTKYDQHENRERVLALSTIWDKYDDSSYDSTTRLQKSTLRTNKHCFTSPAFKEPADGISPSTKPFAVESVDFPALQRFLTPGYGSFRKTVWFLISLTCAAVCVWQLCDRVLYYLQYPTVFDISVIEQQKIQFPAVTLCPIKGVQDEISTYYKKVEENEDIKTQNITLEDIWEGTREKEVEIYASCLPDQSICEFDEGVPLENVKNQTLLTCYALCLVLEPYFYLDYRGVSTWLSFSLPVGASSEKDSEVAMFFIHSHGLLYRHDSYFLTDYLLAGYENTVLVTKKKYHYLSTPTNPCVNAEAALECRNSCIDDLLDTKVDCRLPFMRVSRLPTCATLKNINHAIEEVKVIYNQFDASRCGCPKPCEQIIFASVKTKNGKKSTVETNLVIKYASNVVETVTEKLSYSLTALLSDIGGSLGLFLGFCIFTVFELLECLADIILTRMVLRAPPYNTR